MKTGSICGGRMEIFIEPIEGTPTLCLFGAGHVAQPLARMAKTAGFRVEVADDRVKFANRERFPEADLVIVEDFAAAASRMTLGPNTYAIVVTRGHKGDEEALAACLGKGIRYVGLLASRPKFVHIAAALEERGVSAEELATIHSPAGAGAGSDHARGDRGERARGDDRGAPRSCARRREVAEDGAARPLQGRPLATP